MYNRTPLRKIKRIQFPYLATLNGLMIALSASVSGQEKLTDDRFFEDRVRPVLAENCFQCHGEANISVGLRLDTPTGFRTDDGQGSVLVPGNAEASRLIRAVKSHASVSPMPPEKKLKDEEIRDLEAWVDAGAQWPESTKPFVSDSQSTHWAFQPMMRLPAPKNDDAIWGKSTIDRWLYRAMQSKGLTPSGPASGPQLARRLAFDLTGLPPTLEQVDALEGYESEPEKVAELVDELLNSQAFAEHWARHWLDVARYSDSFGALFDSDDINPNAYTYRDWVVQSIQEDRPYDEFLKLQLNADHMSEPNSPDLAALGFLTVGLKFEDHEPDIIDDRLDTIFRGLQGLSISCARCHDHKYDPISTEDYYSLYSVFSEAKEKAVPIYRTDEDRVAFEVYESELRKHQFAFDRYRDEQHEKRFRKPYLQVAEYLLAADAQVADKTPIVVDASGRRSDGLHTTLVDRYIATLASAKSEHSSIFAPWISYTQSPGLSDEQIKQLSQEYRLWAVEEPVDDVQNVDGSNAEDNGLPNRNEEKPINSNVAKFFLTNPPSNKEELAQLYGNLFRTIGDEWLEGIQTARSANTSPPEQLMPESRDEIRRLMFNDEPALDVSNETLKDSLEEEFQGKFKELANAVTQFKASDAAPLQARVIVDGGEREQYVFVRGKQDRVGPKVEPHFLTILDPEQEQYSWQSAREQLAQSVADPHNPLTARVWVNRVWGHLFGQGIVATPSDFGVRGSQPTHPELLDTLALDFIKKDWSTRELIRKIVLSAAYQQASSDRAEMHAIDPENKLIWRMNRKRLSSESIRDAILATSGMLDRTLGGKPIRDESSENRRRTIYSLVNRRHPTSLAKTFDFANPMMHSPKRHETIVPQQFLWLMNGEFVAASLSEVEFSEAKFAESEEASDASEGSEASVDGESSTDIVSLIYRRILQREPTEEEYGLTEQFLSEAGPSSSLPILDRFSAWRYGTATIHRNPIRISDFVEFESIDDGKWEHDGFMLDASGGTPGDNAARAVVRRWIVPEEGTIQITNSIRHHDDEERKSHHDGVAALIFLNREVVLKKCTANFSEHELNPDETEVKAGDTIDFVVHKRKNSDSDRFEWKIDIELKPTATDAESWTTNSEQHFRTDIRSLHPHLSEIVQLVQVLWMSNEFIYID